MTQLDRQRWTLTLYAVGDGPPCEVRLRRALKHLWRAHGLKCTAVVRVDQNAAPPAASPAVASR